MRTFLLILLLLTFSGLASAQHSWERAYPLPKEGVKNPYKWDQQNLKEKRRNGLLHALNYPVDKTSILLPYQAVKNITESEDRNAVRKFLMWIFQRVVSAVDFDGLLRWLGLPQYPQQEGSGAFLVPFENGVRPSHAMGLTVRERFNTKGFTFACATCHSGTIFGRQVIGMTNRFSQANRLFILGKQALRMTHPSFFQNISDATDNEMKLYKQAREQIRAVSARRPRVLGLDTSIAQISLSMAHRNQDEYATKNRFLEVFPRYEKTKWYTADSKPAVWWNVKYKNRWFLDGGLVSGNPIITNIIWNEIGRGADLEVLEKWLLDNPEIIQELTTAVYASEPPAFTDFFDVDETHLAEAKRGEKIFLNKCSGCHGKYVKAWSEPAADLFTPEQQFKTLRVEYHEQTPVKDVGTDPNRYLGVDSVLQLNNLEILKTFGIELEQQKGYVPPPLVGIWVRWPYMHNNSIPNLCVLLTPENERPQKYYAGPPVDPQKDFDVNCNGYPMGDKVPAQWKRNRQTTYDNSRSGLTNKGHNKAVDLSWDQKSDLIRFLQTL